MAQFNSMLTSVCSLRLVKMMEKEIRVCLIFLFTTGQREKIPTTRKDLEQEAGVGLGVRGVGVGCGGGVGNYGAKVS